MPVVGFLHATSAEQNVQRLAAYRKGLSEAGFVEGRNVAIEFRWANGHEERLPDMVADLIRRQVNVIAAPNTPEALVARRAGTDIPIVFATGGDPVALGLVQSLNRPGGNITGATSSNADVAAKRFGVLRELVPQAAHYYSLVNPTSGLAEAFIKDLQSGAASLGIRVEISSRHDHGRDRCRFCGSTAPARQCHGVRSRSVFLYSPRANCRADHTLRGTRYF
jgi:putative tryptophan/tyrosine transport system substrate-binding protein